MSCRSFYLKVQAGQEVNLPNGTLDKIVSVNRCEDRYAKFNPKTKKYDNTTYLLPYYEATCEKDTGIPFLPHHAVYRCSELFDIN